MNKILLAIILVGLAQFSQAEDIQGTVEITSSNVDFDIGLDSRFNGAAVGFSTNPRKQYGYWGKFEYSENSKYDSNLYDGTVGMHYNFLNRDKLYVNGLLGLGYTRIESDITSSDLSFISIPIGAEAGYEITRNLDLFASASYKWMFDRTGSSNYFGNGINSTSSTNTAPDRYPDKVLCENGFWYDGTASGICSDKGGVVLTERDKTLCNDGTWRDTNNSATCTASDGILPIEQQPGSLLAARAKYGSSVSLGDAEALSFKIGLRFNF